MNFDNKNNFDDILRFINNNNICVIIINSNLDIFVHSNNTLDFNIRSKKNLNDIFNIDICKKIKIVIKTKKDTKTSLVINKKDIKIAICHINEYISLTFEEILKDKNNTNNDISDKIRDISSSSILASNSLEANKYTEILKINNYRIIRHINHLDFMNADLFKTEYTLVNLNDFFNDVLKNTREYFKKFDIIINEKDINIYLDIEKFYIVIYSLISDILINSSNTQIKITVKSNSEYVYIYCENINDIITEDTEKLFYKFAKLHDGMFLVENSSNILCIKHLLMDVGILSASTIKNSGVKISITELSEALIKDK